MALHGLLREEETVADLPVDEALRDKLEHLNLARSRRMLRLLGGSARGELDQLRNGGTPLGHRLETSRVLAVPGEYLVSLGRIHAPGIGLARTLL